MHNTGRLMLRVVFWLVPAVCVGYELLTPPLHQWRADSALRAAVHQGRDVALIQAAIKAGGDPDASDRDAKGNQTTILVNAARRCDTASMRALLAAPAPDPQRRAADTGRALAAAAAAGNVNALNALLEREGGAMAYSREEQDVAMRAAVPSGERVLRAHGARRITRPAEGLLTSDPVLATASSSSPALSSAFLNQSPQPSFGGDSNITEADASPKPRDRVAGNGNAAPPLAAFAFNGK